MNIIFDTETTGLEGSELIESAWIPIDINGKTIPPGGQVSRWRPSKPISLGALATHHIMDEDLADCPPASEFQLPDGVEYLIGHNIDFDWKVIGSPPIKRIDICAMCRHLWPEADSHSQSAMLYFLERSTARDKLTGAHSAGVDAVNCKQILQHVLRKAGPFSTFDDLWQASELMRVPKVMTFGKHKGLPISKIPHDYKRWLLGQPDVDPYLQKALRAR
jgi:exodeoxyribonuclease X